MTDQNVLIPVKLDAFVFNDAVCAGGPGKAKIAPITQPNYSFLRLDNDYLQSDIMYPVDLHNVSGADVNSRITDLGTGKRRENRRGVYLHWTLPRIYRSGAAATSDGSSASRGLPKFPEVPVRWMIVRHIEDMSKVEPPEARTALKPVTAWIVESDRCRTLDGKRDREGNPEEPIDLLPSDADLQVDVSPFVNASASTKGSVLEKQAEIFIGDKTDASKWTETALDKDGNKADDPKSRIDLRLMGSSNELFPDYQIHNSNVFSIVDNFSYENEDGQKLYATKAKADYSVIGWYTKSDSDIMQAEGDQKREARLAELKIKIKGFQKEIEPMPKYPKKIADWFSGDKKMPTRSICHGAMYEVQWDLGSAPKHVAADKFACLLTQKQPVAIGTTPMDAIMAYAGAHQQVKGTDVGRIEAALKRLEAILLSRDDGVESHMQASDMMYNWNYSRLDGGDRYHAAASGDQSNSKGDGNLAPEKKTKLSTLNRLCKLRDAAKRRLRQQQAAAFSNWWLAVTNAKEHDQIKNKVSDIKDTIKALEQVIVDTQREIDRLMLGKPAPKHLLDAPTDPDPNKVKDFEPGVCDPYKQLRDPTLLVGGVQSGWEFDYLLDLLVRLDCQVFKPTGPDDPPTDDPIEDPADNPTWKSFFGDVVDAKMPPFTKESTKALLREFLILKSRRKDSANGLIKPPSMLAERGLLRPVDFRPFGDGDPNKEPERPDLVPEIPLYHDKLGRDVDEKPAWRDQWNDTQPWFPLFLEWELEYTHVALEDWELTESKWWHSAAAKLHYNVDDKVDLAKKYAGSRDKRVFAGRVLILPQPSFSIESKITQLLADTLPSELEKYLNLTEREYLAEHLKELHFLSAPLAGFNGHLQTVDQGNHVKPSIRNPVDGTITFMTEAYRKEAGFEDETKMKLMALETDVTPYGDSHKPLAGKEPPSSFKPVAHGQFKLSKLNIIDKFGQAIHLLNPDPLPYDPKPEQVPRAWPCLSDWYSPEAKLTKSGKEVPNTIEDVLNEDEPQCEFAQVPPQINQPARLNASWVLPREPEDIQAGADKKNPPFWRPANDWDSPIWGWMVVNYANYGLQFFLPSGAFYREVRLAGPTGAQASPEWLPFKKPDNPDSRGGDEDGGQAAQQLARLIETVATTPGYLLPFMAMINAATAATGAAPPSAYAEFKSSLVGKPLALVNMAWSLELAAPATETSLVNDGKLDRELYKAPATRGYPGPGCEQDDTYDKNYYRFPAKLGDGVRGFDGLVGYFKPKADKDLKPGDALDLGSVYSHFAPGMPAYDKEFKKVSPKPQPGTINPITALKPDAYPKLPPYYIDPYDADRGEAISDKTYSDISDEQLCVFGAIVDPFSPVHAWTGVLPVAELTLPNWTWQGPINRLSAFFHAGPVLVTSDVPDFNEDRELTQGTLIPKVVEKEEKEEGVALPGGALGQWSWLQPYMVEKEDGEKKDPVNMVEQFMPLSVDLVDEAARLERGPYTLLEGYLQMASGAAKPEEKKPSS